MTDCKAYSVTATPVLAGPRRAIAIKAVLPNGTVLDVSYRYLGSAFPGAAGPVVLNEAIFVDNYPAGSSGTSYQAPTSTGTLSVESVTPQVVSGTYAGPLVSGGPTVRLVFTKIPI